MTDPLEAPRITRRSALAAAIVLLPAAVARAQPRPGTVRTLNGRVRTTDGRTLGYADFGDASGPLVLYFHGLPGSRLEAALIADEAADCGVRLVAIDRPGIGLSSYCGGRRVLDWPADVACVADALGYAGGAVGVIGVSGGAPYALACVKCMPERLTHVAVVSGHTPMNVHGPGRGSVDGKIELIARRPRLARVGIGVMIRRLHRKPYKVLTRIASEAAPSDRQLLLGNSVNRSGFHASLLAASRQGPGPIITEVQLLRRSWGYRLDELPPSSVTIWQGGCDPIAPPSMGRYFHQHVAGSELLLDPAAGHATMLKWHAREILARFA